MRALCEHILITMHARELLNHYRLQHPCQIGSHLCLISMAALTVLFAVGPEPIQ